MTFKACQQTGTTQMDNVKMIFPPELPLETLNRTLSPPRFARYLVATGGSLEKAIELYAWNLAVSSALFGCIHYAEVALRNSVVEALAENYGRNWPRENSFIRTLRKRELANFETALKECRDDTIRLVPNLGLSFWERRLEGKDKDNLWKRCFRKAFPDAPSEHSVDELRSSLTKDIRSIRTIRNRIAHHEPIFDRPLDDMLENILQILYWHDAEFSNWLRSCNPLVQLLPKSPLLELQNLA